MGYSQYRLTKGEGLSTHTHTHTHTPVAQSPLNLGLAHVIYLAKKDKCLIGVLFALLYFGGGRG